MPLESMTIKSVGLSIENAWEISYCKYESNDYIHLVSYPKISCLFPDKQILNTNDKVLLNCCTAAKLL